MNIKNVWYKIRCLNRRKATLVFYLIGFSLMAILYFGNVPYPLAQQIAMVEGGSFLIGTAFALSTWVR
jgi:hypothetical protein